MLPTPKGELRRACELIRSNEKRMYSQIDFTLRLKLNRITEDAVSDTTGAEKRYTVGDKLKKLKKTQEK